MNRAMRVLLLGALAVGLLAAGDADARTERLRWTHPDPGSVDRFTVHIGPSSRQYDREETVVAPPQDGEGAFYADVTVADDATVFVAVSASNSGGQSDPSNESRRDPPALPPPPPPPPSEEALGAILRFELWNAQDSGSLLDADFQGGEQIDVLNTPCATIEVVGNTYLDSGNAPGSIRFAIDGDVPECTDEDVSHDDDPPYRLGANLSCIPELATPGTYVVSATPFDGNGCTGTEGTTEMITFTVIDSTGEPPPPPPEPLGQPGQPVLVP